MSRFPLKQKLSWYIYFSAPIKTLGQINWNGEGIKKVKLRKGGRHMTTYRFHTHCHKEWCHLYNDHMSQSHCVLFSLSFLHPPGSILPCWWPYLTPNNMKLTPWQRKHDSSIVIQYLRWDQDEMQIRKNITATSLFVTPSRHWKVMRIGICGRGRY